MQAHSIKINVKHQSYSATDALRWLANNRVDLLLLDIKMPGLTGVELVKVLANRPQVIFVTAFKEFAVEAFELDVTDYLVKPVSAPRLSQALEKAIQHVQFVTGVSPAVQRTDHPAYNDHRQSNNQQPHNEASQPIEQAQSNQVAPNYISVNLGGSKRKVALKDIHWFEAYGNYVKVWLGDEMILVNSSFKNLMESLPVVDLLSEQIDINTQHSPLFAKVHKSYGVNLHLVEQVHLDHLILQSGVSVKVGKTYKKAAKQLL